MHRLQFLKSLSILVLFMAFLPELGTAASSESHSAEASESKLERQSESLPEEYLSALEVDDRDGIMWYVDMGLGYEYPSTGEHPTDPTLNGMTTLHWAAHHGNIALAEKLLETAPKEFMNKPKMTHR